LNTCYDTPANNLNINQSPITPAFERVFSHHKEAKMADEFNTANDVVQGCAHTMIAAGISPVVSADALIQVGLSLWAADQGRLADAESLLRAYASLRDAA
jgi:hypothetical protein